MLEKFYTGFPRILIACILALVACSENTPTPTQTPGSQQTPPSVPPQSTVVARPTDIKPTQGSVEYLPPTPMTKLITAQRGPVASGKPVLLPVITWGGDVATIYGNGGAVTQPGSVFEREGLSLQLFREDNFVRAVEKVVRGETPYLRGTLDMVASALEALSDRGIDMTFVYLMTRSTGGDTIVVRSDAVREAADLCGKNIGVQLDGPHMLYIATVLKDAGCDLRASHIRWLRELTIPPYDTKGTAVDPVTAMQLDPSLAAVTVISPDMMTLTSGGTVGTGAEGSVKDAKLLLSTKTAGAIIFDVYAVRTDYLSAHREEVQKLVHGLMVAQEELDGLVNNRASRSSEYQALLGMSAQILRDSSSATADIEGLLADCTFVGYTGNVQFFSGQGTIRHFDALAKEAQSALVGLSLVSRQMNFTHAAWDYAQLAQGLRNTVGVVIPKFDPVKVDQAMKARESSGTSEGVLFASEVFFAPNQNEFSLDTYRNDFSRVIERAATYPGAIILIEGSSDPSRYIQLKNEGKPESILAQTKQAAKNLSLQRAIAVRDSIIALAKLQQLTIDPSQFTVVGAGIDKPKYPAPKNEQEWRANMRVTFQILQIEAEMEKFTPAGGGSR